MPSYSIRRTRSVVSILTVASLAMIAAPAQAVPQQEGGLSIPEAQRGTLHVVEGEKVSVRAGKANSYYPFHYLKQGDFVWAKTAKIDYTPVRIDGPAFKGAWGYIKHSLGDTDWFQLDGDGRTGKVLSRTPLLAPNLRSEDNMVDDSWKRVMELEPGTTLSVLEVLTHRDYQVYRVAMPPMATGWVSNRLIRPATPSEITRWMEAMAPAPETTPDAEPVTELAEADKPATVQEAVARDEPVLRPAPKTPEVTTASPEPTPEAIDSTPEPNTPVVEPEVITEEPVERAPTARHKLDDLEVAYEALQKEAIETAEVEPLRQQYLALMDEVRGDSPSVARYAQMRADQLKIWQELQERKGRLAALRRRAEVRNDEAEAARLAAETTGGYVAVGRLAASTIFEGKRLPRLLRLQDATTGRTIAYLRPGIDENVADAIDLTSMLGQVIGVVGSRRFDEGLRLNLIDPRRVDLLAPAARADQPQGPVKKVDASE